MMRRFNKGVGNNLIQVFVSGINKLRIFLTVVAIVGLLWSYVPWNEIIAGTIDEVPYELLLDDPLLDDGNLPNYPTTTDPDFDPSLVEIENEVMNERTETTKTFRKIDGTYEVAMYNDVIHYYEDDEYKQVDNSLFDNGNNEYENIDNKFKVKFPKTLGDNKQIKLSFDKYSIDWNVLNINSSNIEFDDTEITPNNIKELVNINQLVTYSNIQNNVDIEYILTGSKIKENITLNEYVSNFSLSFEYKIKDLELVTDEAGNVLFINEDNEVIFSFDSLYMLDNDMNESFDVSFDYIETGNKEYLITITPDNEWLQTASYPVKIDPTLTYYGNTDMITDMYVFGYSSSTSPLNNRIGFDGSNHHRSYIKFDLSQIPDNVMVNYAYLRIGTYVGGNNCIDDCTILAKEVYSNLDFPDITQFGMQITDSRIIDYEEVLYAYGDNETYRWDITRNFQEWLFDGYSSRIIELRREDEVNQGYIFLKSVEYYTTTGPVLEIGYDDTNGVHDYWTYNQQPISTAGTGYVSDYTGKFTLSRTDLYFGTELQSLSLSLIYNINDRETNLGYGAGWRTNYNIEAGLDTNNNRYYTIDATGAKTYYVSTTCDSRIQDTVEEDHVCYLAEDGSRNIFVTIKEKASGEVVDNYLVTLEQVYFYFGADGYLDTIFDKKTDLSTYINYYIAGDKIIIEDITDSTGNYIDLTYNNYLNMNYAYLYVVTDDSPLTYNLLEKVYYTYLYEVYIADYTPNYVRHYSDFVDDETFTYDYYSYYIHDLYGRLTTASSSLGAKVIYQYNTITDKVTNIKAYIDSSLIGEVDYTYEFKKTTIVNHNDDELNYWFDNYGHTIQVMTDDGLIQTFKYMNIFSLSGYYDTYIDIIGTRNYRQNHMKIYESTPEYTFLDPVLNGSFENYSNASNDPNWNFVIDELNGYSSSLIDDSYSINESVYGTHSAFSSVHYGQDIHYEQDIVLDEGTYNVSGFIKLTGINSSAYIDVDGATFNTNDVIYISPSEEWQDVSLSFTVANDNTTVTINLNRIDGGTGGDVYFDSIQLIEGYKNTRTNLFENSSFENVLSGWTVTSGSVYRNEDANTSGIYEDILGDYSIKINGNQDTTSSASYDITSLLDMTSENVYTIGIWSKSYGTPMKVDSSLDERIYRLRIEYTVSGEIETEFINFDPSLEEWQKLTKEIFVDSDVSNIKVYLEYKGLGHVFFDGLTIESGLSGKYIEVDTSGNVVSTMDSNFIKSHYDYLVDDEGQATEKPLDSRAIDITTTFNVTEIPLDSNGRPEYFMNNNVKVTPTYNSGGQVTQLVYGNTPNYFTTSTVYSSGKFNQYKESSTDEFGNSTTYDYDIVTGLLQSITNSKGNTVEYEYYDDGLLHKVMNNDYCDEDNPTDCAVTEYVYDSDNMLYRIILASNYYYEIEYDNENRMIGVYINNDSTSYSNQLMEYSYIYENSVYTGKIDTQTYGNDDFIAFSYDDNDRISSVEYSDNVGVAKTRFSYEYDQVGRVAIFNTHDENEDIISTEFYTYNASGELIGVSDNFGNRITYGYDESGNLTKLDFDIEDTSQETFYSFNKFLDFEGTEDDIQTSLYNQTTYTTQDGQSVSKDYFYEQDALYKLDYIEMINGTFTITNDFIFIGTGDTTRISEIVYNIDQTSNGEDDISLQYVYTYDDIGNIASVIYYKNSEKQTEEDYEYDEMNQLHVVDSRDYSYTSETTLSDTNYTKYYYYDLRGNITDIKTFLYGQNDFEHATAPSYYEQNFGRFSAEMRYNGNNDYRDVYNLNVGQSPSLTFTYYDLDWGNQITGMSTSLMYSNLDTSTDGYYYRVYNATYGTNYDLEFRIIFKVGNPVEETISQEHIRYNYSFDWLDQLESTDTITYNQYGIIDTITSVNSFIYDDQGNPTRIDGFKYNEIVYNYAILDYQGRQLTSIEIYNSSEVLVDTVSYTYNDQGYRTSKTVDGITINYYLQGNKVLYETDGVYGIIYTYDFDGKLISFNYDDNVDDSTEGVEYYYLSNQQGDITHIVDEDGNVLVEYYYDAWGNITNIVDISSNGLADINPYRYRGYRYDQETALYYLNSRFYDANIGRFINADGMLGQNGIILSHNISSYTHNNPVMYSDISGEFPVLIALTVMAVVGLGLTIGGVRTDNNTMTAIGLTMVAIPAIATGGLALASGIATGATLTGVIGGTTLAAGIGTGMFASAEYQQSFAGDNWILNTGMSEGIYNGLMIGLATVATLGTAASSFSYSYNIRSINSLGRYDNFYGIQFQTGAGKTRVLSFHTHGHGGGISQWHWQLQKWDPYWGKTSSTIGRSSWWKIWQWR